MLRTILGILAGILAGFGGVLAAQMVVTAIYPLPQGLDVLDKAQMAEAFNTFTPAHFGLILMTYLAGGFVGSYVTRMIARRDWALWIPAGLIALAAAVNVFTYPHPIWAQIGGILAPLLGGWLARRVSGPVTRQPEPMASTDAEV